MYDLNWPPSCSFRRTIKLTYNEKKMRFVFRKLLQQQTTPSFIGQGATWILSGFKNLVKHFEYYIMNIFLLNGKWVILWPWLLQRAVCTWCETAFWWLSLVCPPITDEMVPQVHPQMSALVRYHWGVPQVFSRVKILTQSRLKLYFWITLLQEVFS